jgi:putative ABC transport system substrate-binding protein
MDRRVFLAGTGAVLLAAPLAAGAQQGGKVWRIGQLVFGPCPGRDSIFQRALRDLGYIEGQNVVIECRSANEDYERFPQAASELVVLKVDIIVALNHPAARAAQQATKSIPIVMVASGDPVGASLVATLRQPGGNVTGLSYYATELTAKRLELLKQLMPGITRVAVLTNPALAYLPFPQDTRAAGQHLGIQPNFLEVRDARDLDTAFDAMAKARPDAVFILPDLMLARQAKRIADLALKHRLPTMSWGRWFVSAGGLMAYAADYETMDRRAAAYVDKIIKGAKPADLPVEQPTKFELVINLKTAKALGLTIPPSLLQRADEVIQ